MADNAKTHAEPMKAMMDAQRAMFGGMGNPMEAFQKHAKANMDAATKVATVWTDAVARMGRDAADALKAEADRTAKAAGELAEAKDVNAAFDVASRHVREVGEARADHVKRTADAVTDGAESAGRAMAERFRVAA